MSVDRGMDKEGGVPTCNGIVPSHKKSEIMTFAATRRDIEIMLVFGGGASGR